MKPFLLIIALSLTTGLCAQNPRFKKIKSYKTAFLTEALELSPTEAEKFWPIYNAHEKKIMALRQRPLPSNLEITETQATQMLDSLITTRQRALDLHRNYIKQLKTVLTAKKILVLQRAEENFKRSLLRRMGERRNNRN